MPSSEWLGPRDCDQISARPGRAERCPRQRRLEPIALDRIFRAARTHNVLGGHVTDDQLRAVYNLGKPAAIESTAFLNGSLHAAYLIIEARALGLDRGPMSGFDNAKVDAEFFPDGKIKSNFLSNLGLGDPSKLFPRSPRLDFEQASSIV